MSSGIIDNQNYITPERYISSANIQEYDIRHANISMLYSYGIITKDTYDAFINMPKMRREILVGEMEREDKLKGSNLIYKTKKEGIELSRKYLYKANNMTDNEIVRIANDAVYVNRPSPLKYTMLDINNNEILVEFALKNIFTSFIRLGNMTSVLFSITKDDNYNVEVKGIGDEMIPFHNAFLGFICDILFYMERTDLKTTLEIFKDFYIKFVSYSLPIEYYRNFNAESTYIFKDIPNYGFVQLYDLNMCNDPNTIKRLDISYNLNILREIYGDIINYKK